MAQKDRFLTEQDWFSAEDAVELVCHTKKRRTVPLSFHRKTKPLLFYQDNLGTCLAAGN